MIGTAFLGLNQIICSFVIGATLWFFFIQSPALLKYLGREKFVPIQMQLTIILFRALSIATLIGTVLTILTTSFPRPHFSGQFQALSLLK